MRDSAQASVVETVTRDIGGRCVLKSRSFRGPSRGFHHATPFGEYLALSRVRNIGKLTEHGIRIQYRAPLALAAQMRIASNVKADLIETKDPTSGFQYFYIDVPALAGGDDFEFAVAAPAATVPTDDAEDFIHSALFNGSLLRITTETRPEESHLFNVFTPLSEMKPFEVKVIAALNSLKNPIVPDPSFGMIELFVGKAPMSRLPPCPDPW